MSGFFNWLPLLFIHDYIPFSEVIMVNFLIPLLLRNRIWLRYAVLRHKLCVTMSFIKNMVQFSSTKIYKKSWPSDPFCFRTCSVDETKEMKPIWRNTSWRAWIQDSILFVRLTSNTTSKTTIEERGWRNWFRSTLWVRLIRYDHLRLSERQR